MRKVLIALVLVCAAMVPAQTRKNTKSAAKASLTGCVDEKDGQYVLTNDRNLQPIARLEPSAGTAEDNFARHMGHKVTVRGKLAQQEPLAVLTVEGLETVSETCAPASEGSKQ